MPSTPSITGLEGDVARDGVAALVVDLAHGGADLVVGIGGDVFLEKVDEARIALQDGEELKRAIGGADGGAAAGVGAAALAAGRGGASASSG